MTKSNEVVLGVFLAAISFAWLNLLGGVLVVVRNAGDFVMEAVSVHVTDRDCFIGDVASDNTLPSRFIQLENRT